MEFKKELKSQLEEVINIFNIKDFKNVEQSELSKFLNKKIGKNNWHRTVITKDIHGYRINKSDDNRLLALMLFQNDVQKEESIKCFIKLSEIPYYEKIGMEKKLYKNILKEINCWEDVLCIEREESIDELSETVYPEIMNFMCEDGFKMDDIQSVMHNRNGGDTLEWKRI